MLQYIKGFFLNWYIGELLDIEIEDFQKLDMRVGIIIEVDEFPDAKKPAYRLKIDFGEQIGVKRSSAQILNYHKAELLGRKIIAVVNLKPRQIANFISEVLVMGALTEKGVQLLSVDGDIKLVKGTKIG